MEKKYDKETGLTTWSFSDWKRKTVYWVGLITTWYITVVFAIGFVIGFVGALD